GEILRRALMREPDDASPVLGDLDRHAFAHAAESAKLMMAEQLEIPFDLVSGHSRLRIVDHRFATACPGRSAARLWCAADPGPRRSSSPSAEFRPSPACKA